MTTFGPPSGSLFGGTGSEPETQGKDARFIESSPMPTDDDPIVRRIAERTASEALEKNRLAYASLHRRDDPDTSKEAARVIAGKLSIEEDYALTCVRNYPGHTAAELDAYYRTKPEGRIRKRLSGLEERGLVWRGVRRKCGQTGNAAHVWWAAEGSEQ